MALIVLIIFLFLKKNYRWAGKEKRNIYSCGVAIFRIISGYNYWRYVQGLTTFDGCSLSKVYGIIFRYVYTVKDYLDHVRKSSVSLCPGEEE